MKQLQTLQEMAAEVFRQTEEKRDYVAPTNNLLMEVMNNTVALRIGRGENTRGTLPLRPLAHRQVASRLNIPQTYYHRMLADAPDLLAANVNRWFDAKPEQRLVRTLDNQVRAFLSNKYRPLDNIGLINAVLPTLAEMGCRIESCAVTENRLYVKAVTDRLTAVVKTGDVVQAALLISNSEVGGGSVHVEPMIFVLTCLNGMVVPGRNMNKYHIGRGQEVTQAEDFFTDETRRLDDKTFWMKTRDVVRGSFQKDIFEATVRQMRLTTEQPIENPVAIVERTAERFELAEEEKETVLQFLIKGGDLTRYGLLNAVTAASQVVDSYDRATDMERMGGQILELAMSEWDVMNRN